MRRGFLAVRSALIVRKLITGGVGAVVATIVIVGCRSSAPARSAPSEEPFELTPMSLPSDATTRSNDIDEADASASRPVETGLDAVAPSECPTQRKDLPTDIDITAEPLPRGADAGAAVADIRFLLRNRRGIPRAIQITEVDRLITLDGKPMPRPLHLSNVTFEEGGGGYPEAKIMLHANATAHLIVEVDPPTFPPWRAHIEVDGIPICVEGPGTRPF